MNKLYPFQEEAMPILINRRHTLLADEMGLGKTIQAIELINRLGLHRVLIICKASIKINWQRKLEEWRIGPKDVIQIISTKVDNIEPLSEIVIINYDIISHSYMFQQLCAINWQLIICDEAHYLKNMKAIRTKTVLGKKGLVHHTERSLMMTGTPVLNRPVELFPILKVLSPETIYPYTDHFSYAKRYCAGWWDKFSFNDKGASHTAELNERLRAGYMIRRTYEEVEMQLPKRRYEMVLIEQAEGVKTSLRILEDAERKDFKHQTLGTDAGGLATLRRTTAEAKIDVCIEKIKEYVESVDKIVIFAYHHSVIDKLKEALKEYYPIVLTGNTPSKWRQTYIDLYISTPANKVFIGQIQAAGEGIDGLQKVCHNVLFIESSWVPGEIAQAIARVWRLGQEHPVLIRFLIWANSVEEHMLRVALDKVKVIKEITK
jgi:SWI/SNF-related matrix-associated actin-dependent regulator of chromatin subfamily A-like protein 1